MPDARSGEDADRSAMELLLAQPGGERHAVDLQHLRELLGEAERLGTRGAAALAQWLRSERDALERAGGRGGGDTARLRTQATRDAVTLQTLHSSKGLTYDLVCLPTVALGSRPARESALVRTTDAADDGHAMRVIDLGSERMAERMRLQQEEQRREQFRLLYVAVTRARYITSVCMPVEAAASVAPSAIEELLSLQADAGGAAIDDRLGQLREWSSRSSRVLRRLDPALAATSASAHGDAHAGGAVRIIASAPAWSGAPWTPPELGEMAHLDPVPRSWADGVREVSFTSLSRGAGHADRVIGEGAPAADGDRDERVDPDPTRAEIDVERGADPGTVAGTSAGPVDDAIRRLGVRGVDLGVAMHAALDTAFGAIAPRGDGGTADASGGEGSMRDPLAMRILAECRAVAGGDAPDAMWRAARDTACALRDALLQPLEHGCPPVVELAARHDAVLREMRISIPLDLKHDALVDAFRRHGGDIGARVAPALARTSPARVRGLLSGIIDIVACAGPGAWHVIDWKTNDLGRDPRAYSGRALEDAAASSLYPVQAALYMMLLSRWLRRIGEDGQVVASHYLYVRGMDARTPGVGVWSWSPGTALLEAIDGAVGAAGGTAQEEVCDER
jgi:exodeoxyribonuclease V beta subunit